MDMTKDAIQILQETACRAANAQILKIEGDPDHLLISQGGARDIYVMPPRHRDHKVFDIDSLLDLADKNGVTDDGGSHAVIWHSEEAVVAVLNDAERRDIGTLKLEYSKPFAALRRLNSGAVYEQGSLVRLLKVEFDGCIPPGLLGVVRSLKFQRNEDGESDVQHGKSTLGRRVEANITAAGDIPESFVVSTNVYSNVLQDETVQVRVSIDIDLEEHQFGLSIIGDDLSTAVLVTQESLSQRLMEGNESRRVLFGKP